MNVKLVKEVSGDVRARNILYLITKVGGKEYVFLYNLPISLVIHECNNCRCSCPEAALLSHKVVVCILSHIVLLIMKRNISSVLCS